MVKLKILRSSVIYSKYQQAKLAVAKLKILSQVQYKAQYKKDKKLPANPHRVYEGKGWTSWYNFFGKKKPDFYSSYAKAKDAAKRLSISSAGDYKKKYSKDKSLPSHPDDFYSKKGWTSWYHFLGKK
ncbi:MAG: integrase repeat-containing protein [Candidatus Omnitrophica bacterium]|nr:integrase repeat-containing protein [Candidatus Omnitrophota bacterium]